MTEQYLQARMISAFYEPSLNSFSHAGVYQLANGFSQRELDDYDIGLKHCNNTIIFTFGRLGNAHFKHPNYGKFPLEIKSKFNHERNIVKQRLEELFDKTFNIIPQRRNN